MAETRTSVYMFGGVDLQVEAPIDDVLDAFERCGQAAVSLAAGGSGMTCPHVGMGPSAVAVCPFPTRTQERVSCPCCHLGGVREFGDTDPMPCPYCGVEAITEAGE